MWLYTTNFFFLKSYQNRSPQIDKYFRFFTLYGHIREDK